MLSAWPFKMKFQDVLRQLFQVSIDDTIAVYLKVYFSRTSDINMVGNHFDSVGHSFCNDSKKLFC